MKIRQAKVAQAIRGETSLFLTDKQYNLEFKDGVLHAALKLNPKDIGPFIIFPANIAFIELMPDEAKPAKK